MDKYTLEFDGLGGYLVVSDNYYLTITDACNKLNEQHKLILELQGVLQVLGNVAGQALMDVKR